MSTLASSSRTTRFMAAFGLVAVLIASAIAASNEVPQTVPRHDASSSDNLSPKSSQARPALGEPAPAAQQPLDAEAAAHGFAAARYRLVDEHAYPGFKIAQYDLAVLSHFSYMLTSQSEALLVDPGRDVATYLEAAEKQTVKIVGVWLTHSHADFVAGHIELAEKLGVPIYISQKADAQYPHQPLRDGDTLKVGQAVLRFLETPGHTPDSMCATVANSERPEQPLVLFTGDTLFNGSVGRPDLLGKGMAASTLASMMFDTWTQKLAKLPDEVVIMPAHGAGSLCGAHLSEEPVSTIGQQRKNNPYLQHTGRSEFIAAVLEGLPEAPQYFAHNAAMNRQGPKPVDWQASESRAIEPSEALTDPNKHYVVDLRDAAEYAAGHIPNSVNIGLRGRLETWVGIMVPWEANLVVCGSPAEVDEALWRLHRVGYEPKSLLFEHWKAAGLPLARSELIAPEQLQARMEGDRGPLVVDVRKHKEWEQRRIGTIINLPLDDLAAESVKLDPRQPIVTVCNSAYRSSMAMGVLERQGFRNLGNLKGGTDAWAEANLPVIEAGQACSTGAGVPIALGSLRLAERISADELNRMILDLPAGSYQVVDIRPVAQFADYHLPGSISVTPDELLSDPSWLSGNGPLVIVDRDGSLAMMVAGVAAQRASRPVKALYGGLQAFWNEADLGAMARPMAVPPAATPGGRDAGVPTGSAVDAPSKAIKPTPEKPRQPKRRSAGC